MARAVIATPIGTDHASDQALETSLEVPATALPWV